MGKSFVYNDGCSADLEKENELYFTFGIFIDGTLNNKKNTQLRRKYRKEDEHSILTKEKRESDLIREAQDYKMVKKGREVVPPVGKDTQEYKEYLMGIYRSYIDLQGTDNSYSNDDTNVTRMWNCCTEAYRIYVEGMGTGDNKYDTTDGFAFGSGQTGIRARVRLACERIAERIKEARDNKDDRKKKVKTITLDVFGFSRGAASTRNFVYEIKKSEYEPLDIVIPDGYETDYRDGARIARPKVRKTLGDKDKLEIDAALLVDGYLPQFGHLGYSLLKDTDITPEELDKIDIIVRFIGVYDTVSSYYEIDGLGKYDDYGKLVDDDKFSKLMKEAWSTHFTGNEKELGLHNLGEAQNGFTKMVHFTAQDEHRRNFSLTRIKQTKGRAIEKNLPGVHCDIGGAYENEDYECIDEIGTNQSDSEYIGNELVWRALIPLPLKWVPDPFPSAGLKNLKQDLIDQHWYKDNELEIKREWFGYGSKEIEIKPLPTYKKLTGTRKGLKKEYSYIPLHFMEEFCRQLPDMVPFFNDQTTLKYPLKNDLFLVKVKEHLHAYVFEDAPEWKFKGDAQLKKEEENRKEKVRLEQEYEVIKRGSVLKEEVSVKTDNLDPRQYKPKILVMDKIATTEKETVPTPLREVIVEAYSIQETLRKLRHGYLHWSSNRDWFGMEPNDDRKRCFFPKQ
ncbi:phospholipase effector Tle1 domain-containing protein [uncultured Flavobacterium sp.]|uniref:phospholipase effector Tle1 domain-containing protein n=1 Tax=uncultured Flavobacterium sp. TaxID=165435 RepID=UPI0029310687|nr:DUF2235 domain-containing protein [uncultured Flavobacterium sp.]